jgi:hypothetical protein
VSRGLGAGLASGILVLASIAYANVDFTAADVPTIFYVSKSDDRNRVDYGIRLDARCLPTSGSPMVVYWREFERGSGGRVTHGLNIFEGPVYGVGSQTITERRADGATLDVTVRALSSRRLTVRTGPATGGGCTATATTTIGGVRAVLDHVHLTLGDGAGSLRHADIRGTAVGGGPVTERVVH